MNPSTETLTGAYLTATLNLPDGTSQPVLVRRIPRGDGTFGIVVMDEAAIEFENRFAKTTTAPDDHLPPATSTLTPNQGEESTRIRLFQGDMVMFLGDPDRTLAQGGFDPEKLAHLKQHKVSATLAARICKTLGGKWAKIAKFIPTHFADRP